MKLFLAAILATTAVSAFAAAADAENPPHVPPEVMFIQAQIPNIPDTNTFNNSLGNINATTGQLGGVIGNSVSNIGNIVPTAPPLPASTLQNAISTPRIR